MVVEKIKILGWLDTSGSESNTPVSTHSSKFKVTKFIQFPQFAYLSFVVISAGQTEFDSIRQCDRGDREAKDTDDRWSSLGPVD